MQHIEWFYRSLRLELSVHPRAMVPGYSIANIIVELGLKIKK